MYDILFRGGTVVDGTGAARYRADVAIKDGRIVEIGTVDGGAARQIDATQLVIAPGAIDVHTHYDAQLCWDGVLSASAQHGTTTVIIGNCGIGVAPCRPEDREAVLQDLVVLEGLSYEVMTAGIDWEFETFPQYLDFLRRRRLGLNVAAFVPLSPMRRYGLGPASVERAANPKERGLIAEHIKASVDAGALGFSATMVRRQIGYQGKPLPCQLADNDELRAYAQVLRDAGRGAMQFNVIDSIAKPTDAELATIELLLDASGGRPVTYSGAMYRNDDPGAVERMLQKVEPLRRRGALPQTTISPVTLEVGFTNPMPFGDIEAFKKVFNRTPAEQKAIYRDPVWRNEVKAEMANGPKLFSASWPNAVIFRAKNEKLKALRNKTITEIARERGGDPFDVMIDLALEDDLELKILGAMVNGNPEHLRTHIKDPRVLVGLHDGGAHVDMMFQAGFPTYMLGHWVREEKAIDLEQAIKRLAAEPAQYFGFKKRGRIVVGYAADLMVFNPDTINSSDRPDQVLYDLPAGGMHLYSTATGMEYIVVNGQILIENGDHTGAMPGQILDGR